jgi:hypothetical protein
MTTTRSQPVKAPVPAPRHIWKHVWEFGLAAGLITWLIPFIHISIIAAVVITAVISWGVAAGVAAASKSATVAVYILTAAIAPPAWVAGARLDGVWHWPATAALVAAVAAAMVAGGMVWERHAMERDAMSGRLAGEQETAELRRIERILSRVRLDGVEAAGMEVTRAGRCFRLKLPADGSVTLDTLRLAIPRLAVPLKTDEGAITFARGIHAGEALMTLDEDSILDEDVPLPENTAILTITKPLAVGMAAAGETGKLLFREIATLIHGIRGWGKSNLLNVLIAQFSSCVDVIIFCIDLSGGSLAGPWIQPWADDEVLRGGAGNLRPVIDWVATTREEAWEMLQAVDRLVRARREENPAKRRVKVTPSADKPALMIIGDEVADIFGTDTPRSKQHPVSNTQMVGTANDVTRQSRAAAVEPIWATQRPTISMTGSGDLKSQCGRRISLGQAAEADARSAIPDNDAAAKTIARLQFKGTALIWHAGSHTKKLPVWKIFRLDPDPEEHPEDIEKLARIALRNSKIRPVFDEADLAALGEAYQNRWERSRLFQAIAPEPPGNVPEAPQEHTTAKTAGRAQQAKDDLAEFEALTRDETTGLGELAGYGEGYTTHGQMPRWQIRMLTLIAERPHMGIPVYEIRSVLRREGFTNRDGQEYSRETIQRALQDAREKGLVSNRHKRWYPGPDITQE